MEAAGGVASGFGVTNTTTVGAGWTGAGVGGTGVGEGGTAVGVGGTGVGEDGTAVGVGPSNEGGTGMAVGEGLGVSVKTNTAFDAGSSSPPLSTSPAKTAPTPPAIASSTTAKTTGVVGIRLRSTFGRLRTCR